MKKILVVFLLFVSFNLFAQQTEVGRFNIELRDYDRADEILCNEETAWTVQKPYEIHLKHTFDNGNEIIKEYLQTWMKNADYISYDYRIIYRYYLYMESVGRWKPVWELFPITFFREWYHDNRRSLETEAVAIAKVLTEESGGKEKYTVQHYIARNQQEYTWNVGRGGVDENGEKYYSFKATFIFYVEAL